MDLKNIPSIAIHFDPNPANVAGALAFDYYLQDHDYSGEILKILADSTPLLERLYAMAKGSSGRDIHGDQFLMTGMLVVIIGAYPPEGMLYASETYKNHFVEMIDEMLTSLQQKNLYIYFILPEKIERGVDHTLLPESSRVRILAPDEWNREFPGLGDYLKFDHQLSSDFMSLYIVLMAISLMAENYFLAEDLFNRRFLLYFDKELNKNAAYEIPLFFESPIISEFGEELVNTKANILKSTENHFPVFLFGEPCTGIEETAKFIHAATRIKGSLEEFNEDFIHIEAFNSEGGVDRILFGDGDKKGLLESFSEGGTLFISRVENLPQYIQKKLLNLLQEKKYIKNNGEKVSISGNIKLLVASNYYPEELQKKGKLLPEFYQTVTTNIVRLPSLSEWEGADLMKLINLLTLKYGEKNSINLPNLNGLDDGEYQYYYTVIDPETLDKLMERTWEKGNICELKKILYRYFAYGRIIEDSDLTGYGKLLDFKGRD